MKNKFNIEEAEVCPVCAFSFQGKEIAEEHRESYYGGKTHYSTLVAIEYPYGHPQRYDGVSEYMCPNCKTRWGRWTGNILGENESEPRFGTTI